MKKGLVTWDSKLVDFLSNCNTVIIRNRKEFDKFTAKMKVVGLDPYHLQRAINIYGELLVEYNNSKGFTFWNCDKMLSDAIEDSYKWYGVEPFNLEEII